MISNCLCCEGVHGFFFFNLTFSSLYNTAFFSFLQHMVNCVLWIYLAFPSLTPHLLLSAASTIRKCCKMLAIFPLLSYRKQWQFVELVPVVVTSLLSLGAENFLLLRSEAALQLVTMTVLCFYAVTWFQRVVLRDGTPRNRKTQASFCLTAKLSEIQTAGWRGIKCSLSIVFFNILS